MTTSYLMRDDGRIAYEVHGEGPLVVAVPGMGDLRSAYRFTVPALVEAGYRVATMDLRGHGDSDDGFSRYDDVAVGSDVLALIEHLGGRAFVIGQSMGAGASVWAAAEDPAKVAGLALMGPFVRDPQSNPLMPLLLRLLLLKPWGPAAWQTYYRKLYPGRPPADQAAHLARIRESMRRGDHWRSFIKITRTSHRPAEERLGQVIAPTLVVMGEKDSDFPDPTAEARFVAERLNGELLMVPHSGHYPMAEYPEVVNPVLVSFLNKVYDRG
ncbi:alpha/beta fold hydrolase [Micromonospora polyrhachis]|uniref:Pimeloyl-ACP methyl ester carboxylesterase n=1 Tax=Micromonospora polyrhachis TaxID=1282883 RepID=A0A7W7WQ66_9ACTN|nr:alpha/beta hydrolase [Micromonospora polyrhachis]MBB4959162.1 pimeloyl-ACP methyl ester carboxylesterase [Micromonospora polyrhachis]